MILRSKWLLLAMLLGVSYTGWTLYRYFLDTSIPTLSISGIEPEGYYAGDAPCIVAMSDDYKVADISVYLDKKSLVHHFKINRRSDEREFTIPTKTLTNGKHTLTVEVRDGSYRKNKTTEDVPFFVDNLPLQAAFVKSDTDIKVFQGRTLHIQFQTNKPIAQAIAKTLSKEFVCVPEAPQSLIYECFIPIACEEAPNEYMVTFEITDFVGTAVTLDTKFQIVAYPFKVQQLKIGDEKLKAESESGLPAELLNNQLAELAKKSPAKKLWRGAFYAPINIKGISTDFGTVRTTQHRGKYAHNAVDLLGTPKCVVWAPQDGVIIMNERYAHSGYTVGIDHGCGVISLFFHLDECAPLTVDQKISKGNPVGTLGKTGHATGYHLHWEMRIYDKNGEFVEVDPMQWIRHDF